MLYCFKINCHVVIKYVGKLSLKYKIYNMITIEDFKIKHSNKVRFIGLDLGSKRIGVSICDERQSIATPFKTINKTNTNELIDELKIIIKDNNIGGIIVGHPVNMDGSLGRSAQSVNDVASNISKSIDLPVILWMRDFQPLVLSISLVHSMLMFQKELKLLIKMLQLLFYRVQ